MTKPKSIVSRNFPLPIRLSHATHETVKAGAACEGITASEWIRRRIEGEAVDLRLERIESLLTRLVKEKEGE